MKYKKEHHQGEKGEVWGATTNTLHLFLYYMKNINFRNNFIDVSYFIKSNKKYKNKNM